MEKEEKRKMKKEEKEMEIQLRRKREDEKRKAITRCRPLPISKLERAVLIVTFLMAYNPLVPLPQVVDTVPITIK